MPHPNNLPPLRRPGPEPQIPTLGFCVQCVAELKGTALVAGHDGSEPAELPGIAPAIMLIGGTGCCFTHLQVQTQSSLLVPTGAVAR